MTLHDGQPRFGLSMATSPNPTEFAPLVYAGRLQVAIEALADTGFTGVEISLRRADEVDRAWLARALSERGLVISAFASGRICLEDSLCLCNPNAAVRKKALDRLVALLKLAAGFRAPLIIGGVRGRLTGDKAQRARERTSAIRALRRLGDIAEQLGTCLLLEPINRYETNFVNCAREGLQLLHEIGSPAVRMLLDTFHMNIEEADPCAAIEEVGSCLGYVHCADNNRLAPGLGHIDFPALLHTLVKIDYHGFLSGEILPLPDSEAAVAQTHRYLHALAAGQVTSGTQRKGR